MTHAMGCECKPPHAGSRVRQFTTGRFGEIVRWLPKPRTAQVLWDNDPNGPRTWHHIERLEVLS